MNKHRITCCRLGRSRKTYTATALSGWGQIVLVTLIVAMGTVGPVSAHPMEQSIGALPRCRVYPGGSSDPNKPVLILLQGWNTSATIKANGQTSQIDSWRDLVTGLSDLYRGMVYFSYDRNGEAYSEEDTYLSIFGHHVPLLHDLIQSCVNAGYPVFDLMGHSLGGVVALNYVQVYGLNADPGRIRHVVTLDSPVNGGEQVYKLGFLPDSLDDVVKNVIALTLGTPVLRIRRGDQSSLAEIAAMYESPNTINLNQQSVVPLLRKGTRVSNFTNAEDLAVLLSDAMISGAFGRAFSLGYDLATFDPGHGRIFEVRKYPEVLTALRSELMTQPPAPTVPPPGEGAESSTVLLLDISGSMGDFWQGGVKMESAKNAALDVITMMEQEAQTGGASHRVGIATFSSVAELPLAPTTNYAEAKTVISSLLPTAGTNIGEGVRVANQALDGEPSSAQRFIVLLSDGMTNEGLAPADILSGPVQDAAAVGTCIYTVGFGDPGGLDEDLLRQIASASGCGEYYYASDAYQLGKIYIELRHRSLGQVVASIGGDVQQNQTTPPQSFNVPPQQGELNITLTWPGSTLDLVVTDPQGRKVDDTYPGLSLVPYARFVYMIIQNPAAGAWSLSVFGREVPEGVIHYDAVASVRAAPQPIPPPSTHRDGNQALLVVTLTLFAALAIAISAIAIQTSQPKPSSQRPGAAGVYVRQGYGSGARALFRGNALSIGRDPRNELVLADEQVSRQHAQIRREPEGFVLYDLNSTNGTFVNGQRISRCLVRPGDEIRVGDIRLVFYQ